MMVLPIRYTALKPGHLVPALTMVFLSACGGGGDSGSSETSAAPAAAVATSSAPATGGAPSSPPPSANAPDVTCGLPQFQAELLQQVNAARARGAMCGGVAYPAVPALRWNDKLQSAAWGHSQDMASRNYFSHTSLDGRSPFERMVAAGYTYSTAAENIAAGQPNVNEVMRSWMASAGHCSNIMLAEAQDIAVACARNPASSYGLYWTMNLGRPR